MGRERFSQVTAFMAAKGRALLVSGALEAYCDADMSQPGRVLIFTDVAHNCDLMRPADDPRRGESRHARRIEFQQQ